MNTDEMLRRFKAATRTKPLLRADVEFLAQHMRRADYDEIMAASGPLVRPLADELWLSAETSETAVVCYRPGTRTPIALYGVGTCPEHWPGVGFVWMHGTPALAREARADFLRLGRVGLRQLRERYRLLVCFADSRNRLHTRWLRWMGFIPINVHFFHDKFVPFLEFVIPGITPNQGGR